MCESVMKFESKRHGILPDRRDSNPRAPYSHAINKLHSKTGRYFLPNNTIIFLSKLRKQHSLTAFSDHRLEKGTLLNHNPIFSYILITNKPRLTELFKRNKTRYKSVNIGYKISFSQVS